MLVVGLVAVLAAVALLAFFGDGESVVGLEPSIFAGLASAGVLLLIWSGWFARQLRDDLRNTLQAIAAWAGIFIALVGLYAYRFEFQDIANRVFAEIAPGQAISSRQGEAVVARSMSGAFVVSAKINGRDARMMFDTGATSVVLTAATASALGLKIADNAYTVGVSTANGRTTAAPVLIERISIGSVSEDKVQALVARPGALRENLLGMTFLERLSSYEVRDNRLILRQR